MKSFFLLTFVILLTHSSILRAETFTFDNSTEEWGSWGTGLGGYDANTGHTKKGSLWLSSDWGEAQTVHYNWNKLRPGFYKVTAYVRSQDVQPHPEGSSFWHFYDGGRGTENVFLSLHGSYEWRKVEYTLKVSKNTLSIWFRLKSPGQVWIDDLSLVPVDQPISETSISPLVPLKRSITKNLKTNVTYAGVTLLDFDQANPSHPFSTITNQDGKKMGKFSSHKYYNFEPSSYLNGNWSAYDRVELDVYNGNNEYVEFYLTLGDNLSKNYWSQLNHKTHLAPGWNHLNFSLTQFLGERGSHRFLRAIDRSRIKKIFLVADPNEKFKISSEYFLDNVKLSRNPAPIPRQGVYALDFTSHKNTENSGFEKVTSQHLYEKERGFGFVAPKFWRVEDSQWASNTLRYSIGLLSGHFKMNLPNGKYRMQLVLDRLGYWDPSFWKDRTVYLNDRPIFKESRPYAKDYLNDLLQFEKIIPGNDDHPYDLYLGKVFKPQEFSFTVTSGVLDLQFEGDPTAISLNSLIIWNMNSEKQALKFLQENEVRSKLEFDWMTRPIVSKTTSTVKNVQVATLIDPSLVLSPTDKHTQTGIAFNLQGGNGEKPYQVIQLRGQNQVAWKISDVKNNMGALIPVDSIEVFELIPQYISPDLNHETYMVAGKYLKKVLQPNLEIESGLSKYLFFTINIKTGIEPGMYEGKISFSSGKEASDLPIAIRVMPYDLPQVDLPVGFFGPDPIAYSYFNDPGLDKIRKESRHEALRILGEAGFTTFSGLPEIKLLTDEDPWVLDTTAADEMMTAANRAGMSKVYFSYGGKFPQQFLDGSLIPDGVSEQVFLKKVAPLLNKYLNRPGMPLVVHTFSDEAGGYSDRVAEDVDLGKKIRTAFPFLRLGGFGSKADKATSELRSFFDYGLYSNVSKKQIKEMDTKTKWGSYNASPGNLDDPRFSFGPGLYFSKLQGLSHYLEWHSSSINNFPYYDLDGRESDVTMFMPTSDGKLYPTLRYALAVEGLHTYRKLKLLKDAIQQNKGSAAARTSALKWLEFIQAGSLSSTENILRPEPGFNFKGFHTQLNKHLAGLYNL